MLKKRRHMFTGTDRTSSLLENWTGITRSTSRTSCALHACPMHILPLPRNTVALAINNGQDSMSLPGYLRLGEWPSQKASVWVYPNLSSSSRQRASQKVSAWMHAGLSFVRGAAWEPEGVPLRLPTLQDWKSTRTVMQSMAGVVSCVPVGHGTSKAAAARVHQVVPAARYPSYPRPILAADSCCRNMKEYGTVYLLDLAESCPHWCERAKCPWWQHAAASSALLQLCDSKWGWCGLRRK